MYVSRFWPPFVWLHRGANLSWIFFRERSSMKLLYMINQIFCKLHAKLNFGIFCYSLRWLKKVSTFCLKVIFFVAIALKKQKQIDYKSADRDDPSSTFCLYVVKFGPNVAIKVIDPFQRYILKAEVLTDTLDTWETGGVHFRTLAMAKILVEFLRNDKNYWFFKDFKPKLFFEKNTKG